MIELSPTVWSRIVTRAWADAAFKQRLLTNPAAVLKENGISISPEITVKIIENTDEIIHLTLPLSTGGEISEEALERVAGGTLPYIEQDNRRAK